MLAPHELKNKAFGKSLKGYNTAEVDDYIDFLIDKYTELYRENLELDRKLRIVVTNLDEIRDEEESIRSTLVSAQKMGEKIIRDANERADIITESIKKRCDAVISDFKKQIAVEKEELWNVRATVLDFKKRLFEIYRRQIEDVQSISVNELEQLVLPSDSELVGKIFGEVKATIEEEVRSEHMRREQEEIAAQLYQAHERRETLIVEHQNATQQMAADTQLAVACGEKLGDAQKTLSERQAQRGESQERVRALTQEIDALHEQLAQDQDKGHKAEMILSRTQAELTQMQQRIWDEYELTYAGAKEYLQEPFDLPAADRRTGDIRREIRAMGPVNVTAVEDYRACKERYDELSGQRDDLLHAQDDLLGIIESLQRQMERQFMESFRLMQQYFAETFAKLFGGGHAELRLLDESDVLGCGIEIVAQPPGKKLQLLSLLSGGERALTAIAILFAMLRLKPTPFCFLDEIEAALDDGNISTFADYLREFSADTQFVVVTHRKGTMERCDSLFGVAMEEKGVSKMLSVELKDVDEAAMA